MSGMGDLVFTSRPFPTYSQRFGSVFFFEGDIKEGFCHRANYRGTVPRALGLLVFEFVWIFCAPPSQNDTTCRL